ncbi:MAG: ABC transporter permease [Candidatus Kapabacteria bacterium]|nr:ABC transporter permease [Candidatus Kapabacteria bacterium]
MTQFIESIRLAVSALTANKMRGALTTLGVVIGIFFVLLMGWLLTGLDNVLDDTLATFGDDILYVDKFNWAGDGDWFENRNRKNITFDQYERVRQRLTVAEYVVPAARANGASVRYGDEELTSAVVFGTTAQYIDMYGGNVKEGRFFSEIEEQSGGFVVTIGANVAKSLFPKGDAVGRVVKIEGIPFTVIGVMPKRGSLLADMVDDQLLIPIKRFFGLYGNGIRVVINVKAGGVDRVEDVRYATLGAMREVRSIGLGQRDDFSINTQDQFRKQSDQLRAIVWGVGLVMTGLSFLVGSIGIMNIMFVSVVERTKEIGIRKAIGATRSSVLQQFLVESILLCLIGTAIGVVLTSAVAYAGSYVAEKYWEIDVLDSTISISQLILAAVVSVAVGVLAGIIPAFRASRLDPVEALRAE